MEHIWSADRGLGRPSLEQSEYAGKPCVCDGTYQGLNLTLSYDTDKHEMMMVIHSADVSINPVLGALCVNENGSPVTVCLLSKLKRDAGCMR